HRATNSGNVAEQAQCTFYLGLTAQSAAAKPAPDRNGLLSNAAEWYENSLKIGGSSPGLIHNLARVDADLGRWAEAEALYQEAIGKAEGRQRQGLMRSFADLLAANDRWPLAIRAYRQLLEETPADSSTWKALLDLLSRRELRALPD